MNNRTLIICGVAALILVAIVILFVVVAGIFVLPNLITNNNRTLTAEEIYDLVSPSVVEINGKGDGFTSTGTGFFYDKSGTVITNYHVIEECTYATVSLTNGSTFEVDKVLGFDIDRDIAILSTTCSKSIPLKIRNTSVDTGETVYAIGSSLGLTGSLSNGIVSAAERLVNGYTFIQTTTPISNGNSGGPLIDEKGYVVGIITAGWDEGQNLNLAIPIKDVNAISTDNPMALDELFESVDNFIEYESYCVGIRSISVDDEATAQMIVNTWEKRGATEDEMIALMDKYGASQGGGQLYLIELGDLVEEVNDWCFDRNRKVGDVAIIKNYYGYTICYFSSVYEIKNANNNGISYSEFMVAYQMDKRMAGGDGIYLDYIVEAYKIARQGNTTYGYGEDAVVDYLNDLYLDYGERTIIFRLIYQNDNTYNNDIVDYLNNREDISYDDEVYILEKLGFTVDSDGNVYWD